jgi:hypothetical protein
MNQVLPASVHRVVFCIVVLVIAAGPMARGEQITLATYNIENFREHFLGHKLSTSRPSWLASDDPQARELIDALRYQNDEENWEIAQVILDPQFNPDVLVIQEGCEQKDLEYFNRRWLDNAYETVIVFASNTERNQHLGMMLKPGFKVIERKDQYYLEPDPQSNQRGDRLFARGPVFVLVQSSSGYRFWVGTNHQKSKSGNNVEVTRWRNREARRTHQIIKQIESDGPSDVIFLGDMNDEIGLQEYELEGGGDTIANLLGPPEAGLILATRPLAEAGQISFAGYWRTNRRALIDHVIVTRDVQDQILEVKVFQNAFAPVASDHFPVMIRIRSDPVPTTQPAR